MKVKELVALLQQQDQEAQVAINCVPSVSGFINSPLGNLGHIHDTNIVVIGANEETIGEDEYEILWDSEYDEIADTIE